MKLTNIAGLDRISAVYVPPMRAVEAVGLGEWWVIFAGWVLLVHSPVFVNDGVMRLDGVVKVDHV